MADFPFCLLLVGIVALILDRMFGEPRHHPLVLFGNTAGWLEKRLNNQKSKFNGLLATVVVVSPPVLVIWGIQHWLEGQTVWRMLFDILILMFVIGWQSMKEHALAVYEPLVNKDLEAARQKLSLIVSRQTETMDEPQIVGSTMESLLENGHDCVFASLFWYALLGPTGALLHRLINTLDAMWGYKNTRFREFGFFAARSDDVLGWLPARLTAISYALCGTFRSAIQSWKQQIGNHKSPNAGPVMAAGAGALKCQIGGPVIYDGVLQDKPFLGLGPRAVTENIRRAIVLIERGILLWMGVFAGIGIYRYLTV